MNQSFAIPVPKRATILLVEDDVDLREIMVAEFERTGCKILSAANGVEALAIWSQQEITLVISDMCMPECGGLEVLKRIREHDPSVPPVVFLTGHTDIAIEDALDAGAESILFKPMNRPEVETFILRALTPSHFRIKSRPSTEKKETGSLLSFSHGQERADHSLIKFGRGGFFFPLRKFAPTIKEKVEFYFELANGLSICGLGIVLWTRRDDRSQNITGGCGVEFLEFDADCFDKAIGWLANLRVKSFIPKG